ncbi:MAG: hypothetical protein V7L26_12520 [Nostoc sp.]|uniref:hypothetical protein n=1 Tax=Nostoc sp. TaxID=1180 RepID=UPI002FEEB925
MKLKAFLADMLAALCRHFRPQQNKSRRYSRLSHHQKDRKRPHLIAKYGMKCFWCGHNLKPETRAYFVASCGGVTVEVLKQYVQNQDSPSSADKRVAVPTLEDSLTLRYHPPHSLRQPSG